MSSLIKYSGSRPRGRRASGGPLHVRPPSLLHLPREESSRGGGRGGLHIPITQSFLRPLEVMEEHDRGRRRRHGGLPIEPPLPDLIHPDDVGVAGQVAKGRRWDRDAHHLEARSLRHVMDRGGGRHRRISPPLVPDLDVGQGGGGSSGARLRRPRPRRPPLARGRRGRILRRLLVLVHGGLRVDGPHGGWFQGRHWGMWGGVGGGAGVKLP